MFHATRDEVEGVFVVEGVHSLHKPYLHFLNALDSHLQEHAFLMGARPGAADFGVYGQLTQLAHFDPTPAAITLEKAPRVHAWVSVVEDLSGLAPAESGWFGRDRLPATLLAILTLAGRTYVPVMLANARALKSGATRVETEIDGKPWVQNPFPYQAKCLAWLREEHAGLAPADRQAASDILERCGCGALLHEQV